MRVGKRNAGIALYSYPGKQVLKWSPLPAVASGQLALQGSWLTLRLEFSAPTVTALLGPAGGGEPLQTVLTYNQLGPLYWGALGLHVWQGSAIFQNALDEAL